VPCPVGFSTQRPGRGPQRRPLRTPWFRIRGAATTAMSLHRRGAATKKTGPCRRNPSGRWGSWPISALLVVDDARASTSSSRLDLGSRDPSADGTGGPSRASRARSAYSRYVTARLRRLCLTATSACPMGSPGGEPSDTLRCCRRGEHPEARKHRWARRIAGRSRKLVRYSG